MEGGGGDSVSVRDLVRPQQPPPQKSLINECFLLLISRHFRPLSETNRKRIPLKEFVHVLIKDALHLV